MQPFADRDLARLRAIGDLALATWKRLSDARMERARALKLEGVIALTTISPGHVPAAFDQLRERIREEGEAAHAVCDHVVQALIEQSIDGKSIEWLSEKAFTAGAWRTARNAVLKPKRKPAQAAPQLPAKFPPDPADLADFAAARAALGFITDGGKTG